MISLREASDTYLPSGYILESEKVEELRQILTNTKPGQHLVSNEKPLDLDNAISDLIGLWKYSALSYHLKAKQAGTIKNDIKKANEYGIQLRKMWDYLDQLSLDYVEKIAVELNGLILSDGDPDKKAVLTNIEDYLSVRTQQDSSV